MGSQFKIILCSIILSFISICSLQACDAKTHLSRRLAHYNVVANKLACLSDRQLGELLKKSTKISLGYGETASLDIDGIPVFIIIHF